MKEIIQVHVLDIHCGGKEDLGVGDRKARELCMIVRLAEKTAAGVL